MGWWERNGLFSFSFPRHRGIWLSLLQNSIDLFALALEKIQNNWLLLQTDRERWDWRIFKRKEGMRRAMGFRSFLWEEAERNTGGWVRRSSKKEMMPCPTYRTRASTATNTSSHVLFSPLSIPFSSAMVISPDSYSSSLQSFCWTIVSFCRCRLSDIPKSQPLLYFFNFFLHIFNWKSLFIYLFLNSVDGIWRMDRSNWENATWEYL